MFSMSGFAYTNVVESHSVGRFNEEPQKVTIGYNYGKEKVFITKTFEGDDKGIQKYTDTELDKIISKLSSLDNAKEMECTVTIRLGTDSNYVEASVKGPCSEIYKAVAKLKAQLVKLLV